MDNLVMITAGQQIELSIGAWLGLSTLAAAGLGQICSGISGLTVGGTVDALVARLKLPRSGLTNAQMQTLAVKVARTAGQCAGVTVGCLLGMTCLLFMDTEKIDREKRCAELNGLFNLVEKNSLETVETLIGADLAVLWIYDEGDGAQGPELLARVMTRDAEKNPDCTEILDLSMAKVRSVIAEQKTAVIRSKRGLAKNDAGLISNSIIVPVVTREGQAVVSRRARLFLPPATGREARADAARRAGGRAADQQARGVGRPRPGAGDGRVVQARGRRHGKGAVLPHRDVPLQGSGSGRGPGVISRRQDSFPILLPPPPQRARAVQKRITRTAGLYITTRGLAARPLPPPPPLSPS